MGSVPTGSLKSRWTSHLLAMGLFLALYVPFMAKPIHIDDANFLMLSEGAARDFWRPHDIQINWDGVTKPAFEILANPPGIAWYLVPVRESPEWVLHLWMLPWLALGAWGCARLVKTFTQADAYLGCLYLLSCPVVVISAQALTPDLPVFACMTAGIGGFVSCRRRWPFALLAGCTALFRYSGLATIPLLLLIGWRRDGWRGVAIAGITVVPISLLVLHDLHAYGRVHLLEMFASQNDTEYKTIGDSLHNTIAGIAMLGGAGLPPILIWRRETVAGAILGGVIGFEAAWLSGQSPHQAIPTILFTAAGMAALTLALAPRVREPVLSAWGLGGACFFFFVRFAATRYWAAFVPGVALLALRNIQHSKRWLVIGIIVNALISFGIAHDDQSLAIAYQNAAQQVASRGIGTFSGHWGWQHYLERAGWTPLETNGPPGEWHAHAMHAGGSQLPDPAICLRVEERITLPDRSWGPRVYSWRDRAFYHAGGAGNYAPWTISDEPYDFVTLYRRCDIKASP